MIEAENQAIEKSFRLEVISKSAFALGVVTLISVNIRHVVFPFPFWVLIVSNLLSFIFFGVHWIAKNLKKKKKPVGLIGYLFLFNVALLAVGPGISQGGLRAPISVVVVVLPFFGSFVLGKNGAFFGIGLSLSSLIYLFCGQRFDWFPTFEAPPNFPVIQLMVFSTISISVFVVGYIFEHLRKSSEKSIRDLSLQVHQSTRLASIGEMAGGIAHEINNPLAAADALRSKLSRLLKMEPIDSNEVALTLEKIQKANRRISDIVSSMAYLARTQPDAKPSSVKVLDVVDTVQLLTQAKLSQLGIELKINCKNEICFNVKKDEMVRVFYGLFMNSIEAIQALSEKWIRVEVSKNQNQVEIKIIDSGKGIEPTIAQKMMEPFFTTKPVGKGAGLGLSVAAGIIESHQGSIAYDDQAGNTTFVIQLPA